MDTAKNIAVGAIGGAAYDMVLGIPIQYALNNVPQIGFHEGFNKTEPMVTRITLPDCIAIFTGGAMAWLGSKEVKELGYGLISGVLALKAGEVGSYFANKAGVTYQDQLKASLKQSSPVMLIPRTQSPASLPGNTQKQVFMV